MPIEPDDLDVPPLPPPPVVHAPPPLRSQLEIVRTGSNARWGAIVAGVFVACSAWLVLHAFGVGIGLTAAPPDHVSNLRALGVGIGVWSTLVPIFALFAGGLVVSRLAPTPNRFNRMLHGVLVWAVTVLAAAFAIVTIATSLARGAAVMVEPTEPSVSHLGETTMRGLGLDARDLAAPINGRLRAEGKPPMTASQLERAIDDAIEAAVRGGRLHRETLVSALDQHSALTASDVENIGTEVEARWYRAVQRGSEIAMRARERSLAAADATGKVLLGLSIALMLGLTAAVGGALSTGHRDRRRVL